MDEKVPPPPQARSRAHVPRWPLAALKRMQTDWERYDDDEGVLWVLLRESGIEYWRLVELLGKANKAWRERPPAYVQQSWRGVYGAYRQRYIQHLIDWLENGHYSKQWRRKD